MGLGVVLRNLKGQVLFTHNFFSLDLQITTLKAKSLTQCYLAKYKLLSSPASAGMNGEPFFIVW